MAKHSKYKNTGILYELLVRQIATETLNNAGTPKAMGIIKSHFNNPIISYNINQVTFSEFYYNVSIKSRAFTSLNLAEKSVIGILLSNPIDILEIYLTNLNYLIL